MLLQKKSLLMPANACFARLGYKILNRLYLLTSEEHVIHKFGKKQEGRQNMHEHQRIDTPWKGRLVLRQVKCLKLKEQK